MHFMLSVLSILSTFYEINIGVYYEYTVFICLCQGVNQRKLAKFLENERSIRFFCYFIS